MFETLTKGFKAARNRLQGVTELTEENLDQALRDVRMSLLEADVDLGVVKGFLQRVKDKTVGETKQTRVSVGGKAMSVGPAEIFIKACQDELTAMMQFDGDRITFAPKPAITGIMMVGLQGSGKTTSTGKIARLLKKEGRKVMLVAADVQRPGAIEQLQVLAERLGVPVFSVPGGDPLEICKDALAQARRDKCDTIIYDTAGRLAVDEPLMQEIAAIKNAVKPENVFLVVDAMIGQDAVRTAASFHQHVGLSGVVLTKLDGDARGGAALAIREVTGAPVKYVGVGEALDRLEEFRADGMASRILGFGDIVGLMKDFESVVDQKSAEEDAKRMLEGRFSLDDFLTQIETLRKMGPLQDIFDKLPFFKDSLPEGFSLDEKELDRTKAIVSSMTKEERKKPELFQKQPNRVKRVAKGSGRPDKDVGELLQRFMMMRQMMGGLGQQAGMLSKLPGMKQLQMARQLRGAAKGGGFPGFPGMGGIPGMGGMPGLPGMGGPGGMDFDPAMMGSLAESLMGGAGPAQGPSAAKRAAEKDKKKALRKQQKKSRKKARK